MKSFFVVATVFCLSLTQYAQAETKYFDGEFFLQTEALQMIGASRTEENIERENQVRAMVRQSNKLTKWCYEAALNRHNLPLVEAIIYFNVGSDGLVHQVSADVFNPDRPGVAELVSCSTEKIARLRTSVWKEGRTFRLWTIFSTGLE